LTESAADFAGTPFIIINIKLANHMHVQSYLCMTSMPKSKNNVLTKSFTFTKYLI